MRTGNISFGSIYKIKYDYEAVKLPSVNTFYRSKNTKVNDFVEFFNKKDKEKDDITAINPKEKSYFVKVNDKNDESFEYLAYLYKINIKKVNVSDIEGANITSIGKCDNEKEIVSKCIDNYESYLWYQKERRELIDALPYDD